MAFQENEVLRTRHAADFESATGIYGGRDTAAATPALVLVTALGACHIGLRDGLGGQTGRRPGGREQGCSAHGSRQPDTPALGRGSGHHRRMVVATLSPAATHGAPPKPQTRVSENPRGPRFKFSLPQSS